MSESDIAQEEKQTNEWQSNAHPTQLDDPLLQSLMMITKMYNRPFSANSLTAGLPLVDGRLTLDVFPRAAKRAELSTQCLPRSLAQISTLECPVILLLKQKKACILTKVSGNKAIIIQPESGTGAVQTTLEALVNVYTGNALFIRPNYRFDKRSQDYRRVKPTHWFWGVVKESLPVYGEILLASFFVNLFAVASPLFVMNVYDRVVPNNAVETLWVLAVGITIVYVFDFLLKMLRSYFIDMATKNIDATLSASVFEQLLGLRMADKPKSVGSMVNTVHSFEQFREFMTSTTITTVIDLPFTLIFLFVIFSIAGNVVLVPLLAIPIVIALSFIVQKPLNVLVEESNRYAAEKHATLIESLTASETIKSLAAESPVQTKWERITCLAAAISTKLRVLSHLGGNSAAFVQHLVTVLVVIMGVYKITAGEMTTGALIACTILTGRALAPMAQIPRILHQYHQSIQSFDAITAMMQIPSERPKNKSPLHRPTLEGAIEFRHVKLVYPEQEVHALNDVSFKIRPGEKVGIIGRIGSGKSSIEKIVLGLYEPTEGSLLLDDVESKQLDPADLRRNIGYVPQDIMLFYGTVKENITISAPYVDDQAVLKAAQLAGVDKFASQHPHGFDRQVGERGQYLSGGQRQSIAIARALLLDPPILLMDEPTSAMDDTSQRHLKNQFSTFLKNKTLILITQRGAMLSLVDRLIVMDNGIIRADGPKEKVLNALKEGRLDSRFTA